MTKSPTTPAAKVKSAASRFGMMAPSLESATQASRRLSAAVSKYYNNGPTKTVKARVDVGRVVLPLHIKPAKTKAEAKTVARNRLLHHMAMQEMAGANWQGQPRGFRLAPSSRKNLAVHRPAMLTRVEGLAKAAGMVA